MRYDGPDARPPPQPTLHDGDHHETRHHVTPIDTARHRVSREPLPTKTSGESTRRRLIASGSPLFSSRGRPAGHARTKDLAPTVVRYGHVDHRRDPDVGTV